MVPKYNSTPLVLGGHNLLWGLVLPAQLGGLYLGHKGRPSVFHMALKNVAKGIGHGTRLLDQLQILC